MKLRCPDCRGKFPWDASAKWPEFCPLCGENIDHDNHDKVVMPFVTSTGSVHSYDKLYRDMERGSEFRAQAAAAELGVPVSEVSHLKMTNMRDHPKEGETSHIPIVNEVSKQMDALNARTPNSQGFVGANGGSQFGGGATGDITVNGQVYKGEARAGIKAMHTVRAKMGMG